VGELGLGRGAFGVLVSIRLLGVERETRLQVGIEQEDLLQGRLAFGILEGLRRGADTLEPGLGLRGGVREAA
jgi:hypothetical protein